jgi:hypothetical protein
MAGMAGGPGAGPGGPGAKPGGDKPGGGKASEEEVKGIQLMLQLWEKLREGAEGNPEKLSHIQKIVDLVKQYDDKFVKGAGAGAGQGAGAGEPPPPSGAPGQGPTPGGAAGGETQPVPA